MSSTSSLSRFSSLLLEFLLLPSHFLIVSSRSHPLPRALLLILTSPLEGTPERDDSPSPRSSPAGSTSDPVVSLINTWADCVIELRWDVNMLRAHIKPLPSSSPESDMDISEDSSSDTLGAEGVLPDRHIENFLRIFKQFTHTLPRGQNGGQVLNLLTTLILMGSVCKW